MRVLLVAEQLRRAVPGGIGTYVRGLVAGSADPDRDGVGDHADARAPELTLLASAARRRTDPLRALAPLRTVPLPAAALTRLWDRDRLAAPSGYDVVHAASLAFPPSPVTPLVVAVHDLAWRTVPDAFPDRGRRWHERALGRALAQAATLVVPSVDTADVLLAAGARPAAVEVLEPMYGCDHLPEADHAAADSLLDRLGIAPGTPYLLTVGTMQPRKNLPRLAGAYAAARPRLPEPWPLVVVGPAGWGDAFVPPAGVVPAGEVGDAVLSALYERARCLLYVPVHEGFGLPPAEAMRAGVPVVASPMPSTGGAALEVDPLDVDAMAGAIVTAAVDEGRRASLVEAGRRRAAGLSWRRAADRHREVWAGVGVPR